jgi:glutamate/tyrosine decarboxylase-like PLP-dependent enzyme
MDGMKLFSGIAADYLRETNNGSVFPKPEAIDNLKKFKEPFPENPLPAEDVLQILDANGSPATVKTTGGRYFGFVTGSSLPAGMLSKLLATIWDQNAGLYIMSPIAAILEQISGEWLLDIFGLPPGTSTGFVTGATMANFTALAAARHALLKKEGWDVESNGLFHAPEITVITGDEVHVSLLKALSNLGFGKERIFRVPTDDQGRMIADKIPPVTGPTILCLQAGNVNTGSFDPIGEICKKINGKAWIHIDGAFGLWAAASPELKHFVSGIELADSWATDAHKWLNVPYDTGLVFVKNQEFHFSAISNSAAYLPGKEKRDPFQFVPEMSREARGVPVWAVLKSLGRTGLTEMIERNCAQARLFADGLRTAGYKILNDVVLNQVLVSFGSADKTNAVIQAIQEDGTCWCGGTIWHGETAMRISVSSWATTNKDIEISLAAVLRIAEKLR